MHKTACIFIVLVCFSLAACATKVSSHRMAPARFPVAGIETIAVAAFDAEGWRGSHWAALLSQRVTDTLETREFYQVVPGKPDAGAGERGGADAAWRAWGRQHGADGILAGTVRDANVRRSWSTRKVTEKVHTGEYRTRVRIEDGGVRKHREEIVRTETRYVPVVHTYARLSVVVALLNVKTGARLAYEEYSDSMSRSAEGEERIDWMPEADEMMERLVDNLADRIVRDMVPHLVSEKIRIEQDNACIEGNKLARQGDWEGASDSWRAVVAADPANHAAWYNLGVAAEMARQYDAAVANYERAVALSDKKIYRSALDRARRYLADQHRLDEQMKGRD